MAGMEGMLELPARSTRAPNFSPEEVRLLTDEVLSKHHLLYGRSGLRTHRVGAIWLAIARRVKDLSGVDRSPGQIRRRWMDVTREVRIRAEVLLHREITVQPRGRSTTNRLGAREWRVIRCAHPDILRDLQAAGHSSPAEGSGPSVHPHRVRAGRRKRAPVPLASSSPSSPSSSSAASSGPPSVSSGAPASPPPPAGSSSSPHPPDVDVGAGGGTDSSSEAGHGGPGVVLPGPPIVRGAPVAPTSGPTDLPSAPAPHGVGVPVGQVGDFVEEVRAARQDIARLETNLAAYREETRVSIIELRKRTDRQHGQVMALLRQLLPPASQQEDTAAGPSSRAGDSSPDCVVVKQEKVDASGEWVALVRERRE